MTQDHQSRTLQQDEVSVSASSQRLAAERRFQYLAQSRVGFAADGM